MTDVLISVALGCFFTALGYGVIGPRSGANPSQEPRHIKAEKLYRFVGPALLVLACFRLILQAAQG